MVLFLSPSWMINPQIIDEPGNWLYECGCFRHKLCIYLIISHLYVMLCLKCQLVYTFRVMV